MTPQYKTGGSWTAISDDALAGTWGGTCHVEYPEAVDRDGNGLPCGAVGKPRVVIRTPWMTDTGMGFWRAFFTLSTDTYAAISIEVFDPRTGTDVKLAGYLERPAFASVGRGAAAGSTVYRDVTISIVECAATT